MHSTLALLGLLWVLPAAKALCFKQVHNDESCQKANILEDGDWRKDTRQALLGLLLRPFRDQTLDVRTLCTGLMVRSAPRISHTSAASNHMSGCSLVT